MLGPSRATSIPFHDRSIRMNPLTLLGSIVIVTGVVSPWFGFHIPVKHGDATRISAMAHCYMSPFTLVVNLASASKLRNTTIYVDTGIIDCSLFNFYSVGPFLVGVACVAGAALSSVGESANRLRLTLAAGLALFSSTLSFSFLLPSKIFLSVTYYRLAAMSGFWLTILGAILIFVSIGFRLLFLCSKVSRLLLYDLVGFLQHFAQLGEKNLSDQSESLEPQQRQT